MDVETSLPTLARADSAPARPRLGGMARPDGVVIVSDRFWAFARRDGTVAEGDMPRAHRLVDRMPLIRGVVRLVLSLSPLFRARGVAGRRERWLLAAALAAPLAAVLIPAGAKWPVMAALTVGLLGWLLRGRTLFLHGAEHRAIAAVETGTGVATWHGERLPSRFASRCGTNFAALLLPVTLLAGHVWPFAPAVYTPVAVTVVSLALTMELWRAVQSSPYRIARVLLLPGLALQRVTTREPALDETRLALTAAASVLRRELG